MSLLVLTDPGVGDRVTELDAPPLRPQNTPFTFNHTIVSPLYCFTPILVQLKVPTTRVVVLFPLSSRLFVFGTECSFSLVGMW